MYPPGCPSALLGKAAGQSSQVRASIGDSNVDIAPLQANMHGDEPTGRQLTLALAEWLCGSRGSDPRAARLLDDALLYLLPTMNPDGFAGHRRENRFVRRAVIAPSLYSALLGCPSML